ncbi:MAG: DUF92 domain-containing protein [Candidatus Marinimicrobia bacterium]|nr:DUF92 domain-containing protein [Candidatus Neomarinimicrobiota bacterium]MBT3574793.1 DUF92 domain-containing protein [Candidatus Neomarinimicrobiota bacterium]MBT3681179.1 DUF92 domain-containing protein [Candidatus Neomarinimicrobiota bacterium]MBT3950172.1 DUF92 domain-containing protein [Candidatus Neomarinimicrobiota bacterium]MBT4254098.1 DUF92 domain-containing protein [Candidatus Neomarinimicrobiota bacterium]
MPIFFDLPNEWIAFLVFFSIIIFFIGIAEIARTVLKLSPELSRKFVHVMVGILVSLAPFFLQSKTPVILLGVIFTILNYIALRKDSLKGMHTTERVSFGTVYFPIAFTLLVIMFWDRNIVLFIVAMLVLAFSDTAATVVGERINSKHKFILWHDKKSWPGSIAFFVMTLIVVLGAFPVYSNIISNPPLPLHHLITMAFFTAFVATVGEAVSKRGSDNLTLTLTAALGMDLYLSSMHSGTIPYMGGWFAASMILGYGAYKLKSLSVSGGFGAFLLGVFMFGMGSWQTMLPLIGFFVLSSLLSKIADRQSKKDIISSKGSQRDIVQVYANGGIPLIFTIAWYLSNYSIDWLYWAFLASLASATADTWETEIGSFSKSLPLDILSWKRVPKGYSGGISLLGTSGGVLGAAIIVLIAVFMGFIQLDTILIVVIIIAGFLGSIVDSILGASIQAKFKCEVCGKATERVVHCHEETTHISGMRWLDNDWVNVAGSLSGGLIFMLLYLLFL